MSLIATWFSEGRRAQHPPVPRYPLRICRWRVLGRQYGAACVARPARRYPGRPDRHPRHLQGRPADAVARQFCAAGRNLRRTGCHVRAAAQQLNTTSEPRAGQSCLASVPCTVAIDLALQASRRNAKACAKTGRFVSVWR